MNPDRKFPVVFRAVLIYVVGMCAALYAYYFFAQDVVNPKPVQGVLTEATCRASGISQQGAQTGIPTLWLYYEFPSRAKDVVITANGRPMFDRVADHMDYKTNAECFAAAQAQQKNLGSKRTIWAGENSLDDRFRARFTEHRVYPPHGLLWIPGCVAAFLVWLWRRLVR